MGLCTYNLRDVERQQIDLNALSRLNWESEGTWSWPNFPRRCGRAEEARPTIHHRLASYAAVCRVRPDYVVANCVGLSLHGAEGTVYIDTTTESKTDFFFSLIKQT